MSDDIDKLGYPVNLETPLAMLFSARIVHAVQWGDDRHENNERPTIGQLLELGPDWLYRAHNIGPYSAVEVHMLMWRLAQEALSGKPTHESRLDAIEDRLRALEGKT